MSESLVNSYRHESVVCPRPPRKSVFTIFRLWKTCDNNPSVITANSSFHDTVISLYQLPKINRCWKGMRTTLESPDSRHVEQNDNVPRLTDNIHKSNVCYFKMRFHILLYIQPTTLTLSHNWILSSIVNTGKVTTKLKISVVTSMSLFWEGTFRFPHLWRVCLLTCVTYKSLFELSRLLHQRTNNRNFDSLLLRFWSVFVLS